jgi:nucleoside 2-deoxyribosyltransferase
MPRTSPHAVGRTRSIHIFLSHAHKDAALVKQTAGALASLGLVPFVAAHDIPPAREWLEDVQHELTISDALAAFLTPEFRASAWADQEVGYALAQGKKVLPIQLDAATAPHGFLERYQAVHASNMTAHEIAVTIFNWLFSYDEFRNELIQEIISHLHNERFEASLRVWVARLSQARNLSGSDLAAISGAIEDNPLISTNRHLQNEIQTIVMRVRVESEQSTQ